MNLCWTACWSPVTMVDEEEYPIDLVEKGLGWAGPCPLCLREITGFTAAGAEQAIVDHVNEWHNEAGRIGHA